MGSKKNNSEMCLDLEIYIDLSRAKKNQNQK